MKKLILTALVAGLSAISFAQANDIGTIIEAEDHNAGFGTYTLGTKIGFIHNDDWIGYVNQNHIEFGTGTGATAITVRAASQNGGQIRVKTDSRAYGPTVATIQVTGTGGFNDFEDFTVELDSFITGNRNVFFIFDGANGGDFVMDVDHFIFHGDVGAEFSATDFVSESAQNDPNVIRDMGNKVGYLQVLPTSHGNREYLHYGVIDLQGATTFTVRAASGSGGGTLYVRRSRPYAYTIATVQIPNTGGFNDFQDFTVNIDQAELNAFNGAFINTDLYLVIENDVSGYQFDIESFRFDY